MHKTYTRLCRIILVMGLAMAFTVSFKAAGVAYAQSKMTVTFTTSPTPNERYAPRNVVAVWIEDSSGRFIKTLMRYAGRRIRYLRGWNTIEQDASKLSSEPDVVTGATRRSHGELMATWDLTDSSGQPVADGDYVIRMELADRNASSTSQNNEGQFAYTRSSDGTAADQTKLSNGGFDNVSIRTTAGSDPGTPGGDSCGVTSECVDDDGCCGSDCVFEVDNDCSPNTARDAAGGCSTGTAGDGTMPGSSVVLLLVLLLYSRLNMRSTS